jgi:hypothetical protein
MPSQHPMIAECANVRAVRLCWQLGYLEEVGEMDGRRTVV